MKQKKNKECEKCGKLYRLRALYPHKPTGELRCKRCMNKYGNHKFFIPKERREVIGKYSISDNETKILFRKFMEQGMTKLAASRKINYLKNSLKKNKKMRTRPKINLNKKFKESFRNLK